MKVRPMAMGLAGVAALLGCAGGDRTASRTAYDLVANGSGTALSVRTSAVDAQSHISSQFTADGAKLTPQIRWSGAPPGTKEFEVLVEDPDAPGSAPYVHLLIEGLAPSATSTASPGTLGPNSEGEKGYAPFDPPPGKPHHYHFEVFAVDRPLATAPVDRDGLIKAISGHVLAKGEAVGVFGR